MPGDSKHSNLQAGRGVPDRWIISIHPPGRRFVGRILLLGMMSICQPTRSTSRADSGPVARCCEADMICWMM